MATFCCIYGLNDGEETIGSERVVGERKLKKRSLNLTARGGPAFAGVPSPVGIIASQIDLSEAMITQQVTDEQLLSVLFKYAKLLSQTPIQAAGIKTCRFSLFSKAFSELWCYVFKNSSLGKFFRTFL